MEKVPIFEIVSEFCKKNKLFLVIFSLGMLMIGIGVVQYFQANRSNDIEFITSTNPTPAQEVKSISQLTVDVSGEVMQPGVYQLDSEARVQDALEAAGGLSSKADDEYVAKRINLAHKLKDGAKIYIPYVGELDQPENDSVVSAISSDAESEIGGELADTLDIININTATETELDTLPKVGPVTAKKIIENRPYGSIEELVAKKVVGQKTFENFKDLITAL